MCPVEGYSELHHILPRSLGGDDTKQNLVRLTAREHFICHLLLVRIHKELPGYYKMVKAFFMMLVCKSSNQERHISSRDYSKIRETFSKLRSAEQSGHGNSQYGKQTYWMFHEMFGRRRVDRTLLEDYIHQGWYYGSFFKYEKLKKNRVYKIDLGTRNTDITTREEKETILTQWYRIYETVGFDKFCAQTGYSKSKPNLVQLFSRYVSEFTPQNGKKRNIPS